MKKFGFIGIAILGVIGLFLFESFTTNDLTLTKEKEVSLEPSISIAFPSDNLDVSQMGIWQGIVDGKAGEGSLFYRLEFEDNGGVSVSKQYGGHNLVEEKKWELKGNLLTIEGTINDEINDFDNAVLELVDDRTLSFKSDSYAGVIQKWNKTGTAVHWIVMLLVLLGLNELFRRYKWATVVFYFVLPFALIPLWDSQGVTYWFKWVKVYSVVFAVIWFTLMRYTKLGDKNYAKFVAMAFLALNIAETVNQDLSMGFLANSLNGIAGILSIVTISGWKGIHIENSKTKDMVWPAMTIFWIIAYDIWNFVFVYLNFPGSAATQFLVLLSCTIPALLITKGTWLQARAFTLAAWFMYYFTAPRFIEAHVIPLPRNENLMLAAGILSIAANGIYAYIHFNKKLKNKRLRHSNPDQQLLQEISNSNKQ